MTKNKMHNFGELGKWSEDTLKAQTVKEDWGYDILKVETIEDNYNKKVEEYCKIEDEKVKKMSVEEVWNKIKELKGEDKLDKDYEKYKKVMEKFNKKKGGIK